MALSNEQWNAPSGGGDFYDHQIANSCRWDGAASKLVRDPSSSGNLQILTFSTWVKRSKLGSLQKLYICGEGVNYGYYSDISFDADDKLFARLESGGTMFLTTQLFRDTSAYYHILMAIDTTQGTADNRCKVYVNGERITAWDTDPADTLSQNYNTSYTNHRNGSEQWVGAIFNNDYWFGGYMAETYLVDGTQLAIGDTGETKNGVWIPKDPSGFTFGTNGFYLNYATTALGNDVSGNNNDFTATAIAASDQMLDSPTFGSSSSGNFCTINPVYSGTAIAANVNTRGAITKGNLKHAFANNQDASCPCTIKTPPTGKWYFEYAIIAGGGTGDYSPAAGIIDPEVYTNASGGINSPGNIAYDNATNKVKKDNSFVGTYSGSRGSNGDVMGIAVDLDNGALYVSKNGTYQTINGGAVGDPTSGASKTGAGATWTPASEFTNGMVPLSAPNGGSVPIINLNFGQDGTFQGTETAGGNADANDFGNFFTAPPTDYLAVCTGNLTAAADPAEEEQPSKFFQALAYTGNGQNGHDLTTVMKADSVWGKNRTTSAGTATRWFNQTAHNFGTGAEEYVQFDQASYGGTTSQAQGYSGATATNLTVGNNGYTNVNNSSYINYLQGSNGASVVTDTSGDIDVARFATANQGMSVMYYTGTGTSGHTVPHGLGVKPDFIIIKNSTSQNSSAWRVYAKSFGDENDYAVMNTDAAWQESGGIFTADPTTSVMALADDVTVNNGSNNYMAWAYANAEGMVKAGKYYGNANDDGVFVYTGFRPAMFMCKPIVQGNWRMFDTTRSFYNVAANTLFPNSNAPQQTNDSNLVDILSNGVKMRASDSNYNQATTFHYLAFAENPFKYETAR